MANAPPNHDPNDFARGDAPPVATTDKFCILGAGSSGLAVAKNFRQQGIPFDCLEREDDVGGNWYFGRPHSSVYRSTRLISSKAGTQYPDFPMPAGWAQHPGHEQVWRYLRDYAEHFGLRPYIEFNTTVKRIEAAVPQCRESPSTGWDVVLSTGETRRYRAIVIANGHNWDPRWPEFPGNFEGEVLHSGEYKSPERFAGRRVLVVGGGNSGFDIAADVAPYAGATFHSLRRAYHVLPRFFQGTPIDQCGAWMYRWRLPLWLKRWAASRTERLAWRDVRASLPRADHRLFETHPVINGRWPHDVASGRIIVKPNIRALAGDEVEFVDASRALVDAIIYATGYKLSFPFIDRAHLNWQGERPELYLNIFHPQRDDLFVVGLIQPNSGQFGLVDYQARLVAAYVKSLDSGAPATQRFQQEKRAGQAAIDGGIRYVESPRHLVEVDRHSYKRCLKRAIRELDAP